MVAIRADERKVYPRYLFAVLRSDEAQRRIANMHVGTLIPHFKKGDFDKLFLPIPSRDDQVVIGDLYFDISARIDLLRKTNVTLESIAQTLFKSWFIDFDPVRAKAGGREPDGMDAATAALFTAEFEESALGLIPKGWCVKSLGEVSASIFSGGTPDTRIREYWNGSLPWFSSGETRERVVVATEKHITEAAVANSSTRLAKPGDVLIASAGQGLTRGQTSFCAIDTYINQSVVSIRANPEALSPAWIFYNVGRRYEELRSISDSHSIRGSLTTKLLASLRVIAPPTPLGHAFGAIAEPLLAAQAENCRRVGLLSELRDTLLPRLISGKLRLPDTHGSLEEAIA
jgi:type I restriction enzyme S subunit